MSSPGTPKQKKGIRQLLKESFRSRSRSPSESLLQPDLGAASETTGSDEGAGQIANPGRGRPLVDGAVTTPHQTNISPMGASQGVGRPSSIPVIVEPVPDQEVRQRGDATIGTQLNIVSNDASESSHAALEAPTTVDNILDRGPDPIPPSSEPIIGTSKAQLPINAPPDRIQRSRNSAWSSLRGSLGFLKNSSSVFPQLSSALESLLSCLDGLEVAVQHRQDFEDLATELALLSESLTQHMNESSSIPISGSTASVALAVERQAMVIRERLDRASGGGIRRASMDEEELVKHYRKIQSYFRQLQTNASMSTWSIANEQLVNTRLESLSPVKQAAYDSSLSIQINRRGCTEGTRIGVLDSLDDWLYDPTSSSIYWMNGMAGTGKTTIASTFCDRAERRKLLAASFFCTRASAECRDVGRIVPTIAYQLARYSIPFQSALCKILGQNPDIGSKNMLKQFEQLLKEPLQQVKDTIPNNLVVVIDALDECDDRNGVELVLDMLFRHAAYVPLSFLVTSRPEPEIYNKMSSHAQSREAIHLHDIEQSLVRADIELYLKEELEFMSPPASQAEIEQLVQRAGTLFIYAATLVRYIRSGKRLADPHKRLRSALGLTPESTKKHTQIDALYTAVLKSALNEDDLEADEAEDIRVVLRTVLFAQEPISVETIANLAEIDDPERVIHALHPLRSVLHQSDQTGLVSTLHASFPDFMFSNERSGLYFYDVVEHSQLLAGRCLLVMKEQLRFNICNLASSFVPDVEVENLQERIKTNISPTLAYACRHWASHLGLAIHSDKLHALLDEFLSHRLLFWMEVLSLRKEMSTGIDGLLKVQLWLMHAEPALSGLVLFVDDARSFLAGFASNPTSYSTPHVYISSLAFSSHTNLVCNHYKKRVRGLLELQGSLTELREAAPLLTWTTGSEINSLALSPDGTRVVVGFYDATVRILSAYNAAVYVGPLQGHTDRVTSVAFSPDGGRIASASIACIRIWNAYNGTLINDSFKGRLGHINSVSFSPDGTLLVSAGLIIQIWNAHDGTPRLAGDFYIDLIHCAKFSPNGAHIAFPSADHAIQLWRSSDGTPVIPSFKGHTSRVICLAFTPDGSRLVSSSIDNTVRVWNTSDGTPVTNAFEGRKEFVKALAISPDGTRIAGGGDNVVWIWKIEDGTLVAGPFFAGTISPNSLAYSPDGTRVFSGYYNGIIRVWNVRDGIFPPPPPPPQNALIGIKSVTFSPDNLHFLSSGKSTVNIWNATDGSFITSPNESDIIPAPFSTLSPDGSCIASTSKDGNLQIIDTICGSLVAGPFEVKHELLSTFCFSRDGRAALMGCDDGTITICGLQSENSAVRSFKAHHKRVSSVSESRNSSLLVSLSDYEMVLRIWNIATPALDLGPSKVFDSPTSGHSYPAIQDGWNIREDGWVVNSSQHLLFWLPPDLASAWCSPYATLVITRNGILRVPKQRLFIGDEWAQCYVPNESD
ncbi:unnamed protein product [Rhizoctonia solani]|uniref:NACHT domain-containing protein n=1 Tax=Rhizoctonia solani TaxID=456999 RepID=A0A8H3DJV9_9AGAM|nr:unnamed protein product [Rhizoctonia solani]